MKLDHRVNSDLEKNLEESFRTLLGRRSNGGGVKYKIIDVDGTEISLTDVLERYFLVKTTTPLAPSLKLKTIKML